MKINKYNGRLVFERDNKEIAKIMQEIKQALGLSRKEFAGFLGIAPATLDMVLLGRSIPNKTALTSMAQYTEKDEDVMFLIKKLFLVESEDIQNVEKA